MKLSVQERHKGKKNKMEKKRIILASGSPRRKELLEQIGICPQICPSNAEEKKDHDRVADGQQRRGHVNQYIDDYQILDHRRGLKIAVHAF